ncbi:hypothetical protein [Nonomuraea jabiensis]|uniref:hypothetical protein n=1 Tax=Nonomuraea jabiensis TaxID=882448 RepID=UPI003D72CDA1
MALNWVGTPSITCQVSSQGYPYGLAAVSFQFTPTVTHTVEVLVDGFPDGIGKQRWTGGTTANANTFIPADGKSHTIRLVDDGTSGTPAAESIQVTVSGESCGKVLSYEVTAEATHPVTKQKYIDVTVTHTGSSSLRFQGGVQAYSSSDPSSRQWTGLLAPGESEIVQVVIPANGLLHVLKGFMQKEGDSSGFTSALWHVVRAFNPPPDPAENATEFFPGETVIITSSPAATPLATDGSEWVMLELRERAPIGQTPNPWTLVGTEGGLVPPRQDGTWVSSIETSSEAFPIGSKWDVRSRRFRAFKPSEEHIEYFDMINPDNVPPPPPPAKPVITSPASGYRHTSTVILVPISGTGTPGSTIGFKLDVIQTSLELPWDLPMPCTVDADGNWTTHISRESSYLGDTTIAYSARAKRNGLYSEWSDPVNIVWPRDK